MIIPCKYCNQKFELLQATEYLLKMGLISPETEILCEDCQPAHSFVR